MTNLFWIDFRRYQRAIQNQTVSNAPIPHLETLSLYNRINTLSSIFNAKRGWLGASFSIAEILTCLYFDLAEINPRQPLGKDLILLSKGHAAAMQYACLFGRRILSLEDLKRLNQPDGPQAHTDRSTPGIAANTGSLGQTLSKACGLSVGRKGNVFVILGDGELQEGQNWEAFQSLYHRQIPNVIPIIDRNFIQSDSSVADIKSIPDLKRVLEGFGLNVLECDGNRIASVHPVLKQAIHADTPTIILANTKKAAGVSFMEADTTDLRAFQWHGPVTRKADYLAALKDLSEKPEAAEIREEIRRFLTDQRRETDAVYVEENPRLSTGDAFGQALVRLAPDYPHLVVLDGDLEKACRLTEFAKQYPDRFLEMGIAEQDMVSCAGGLALQGKIPVVSTYAAFFRRAFEQIYINATEKTRIIYAGHYAGLCYFADGKSHQCTGDVAMMRSIPGMTVLYPSGPEETGQMLEWILDGGWEGPVYIRLHRTPDVNEPEKEESFHHGYGVWKRQTGGKKCLITSGPHMTRHCLEAAEGFDDMDVTSVSTLRHLEPEFLKKLTDYEFLFVAEELYESGGLFDEILLGFSRIRPGASLPKIRHRAVAGLTHSTLDPSGLYRYFELTSGSLAAWIRDALRSSE